MKIPAVNMVHFNTQNHNRPNFKGIFIGIGESHDEYDYHGCPSGVNPGHYVGSDDSVSYVYHPFRDESEANIQKVLEENNYYNTYDPEMTGGFGGSDSCTTTRAKRLPYTEREWNRMSKAQQDKIRELLKP